MVFFAKKKRKRIIGPCLSINIKILIIGWKIYEVFLPFTYENNDEAAQPNTHIIDWIWRLAGYYLSWRAHFQSNITPREYLRQIHETYLLSIWNIRKESKCINFKASAIFEISYNPFTHLTFAMETDFLYKIQLTNRQIFYYIFLYVIFFSS